MRYSGEHIDDAVFLLKELVKIPSYTFQEEAIADFLEKYLTDVKAVQRRKINTGQN